MMTRYIEFIKKYLLEEKLRFIILMLVVTIHSVVQVIQPLILLQIIDVAFPNKNVNYFFLLIVGMASCYIFSAFFCVIKDYLSAKISENLCLGLRKKINRKITLLKASFFDDHALGDVLSKYSKEVEVIKNNCGYTLIKILGNAISLLVTGYVIMRIDWRVMLVSVVFIMLYIACNNYFGGKVRLLAERSMKDNQNSVNAITDNYNNVAVTKIYSAYRYINSKFESVYKKQYDTQMQLEVKYSMNINISSVAIYGLITIIWLIEGFRFMADSVSIGTITALINYQSMLVAPMIFFSQFNNSYQSTVMAIDRIDAFLNEAEETVVSEAVDVVVDKVDFRNVSFGYRENCPILENVNMELSKGKIVGFVGESGSGKSTIVKMLLNFYKPQQGEILINDENIDNYAVNSLRERIVYSTQDSLLFRGSIKENLVLGKNVDEDKIIEFSKKIDIYDEVNKLPDKWEEQINEGSSNISGGQRKRLDILRMLVHNSDIMIFDESTAFLDQERRTRLFNVLKEIKEDKIIVFITHNMEECKYFDDIYSIRDNRVLRMENA
ncbi:MAG: ABC transporter ATP-binding protein [Butyrivibrio hungatei]|nr:ABC transporter ATP-binding protein [Butyrivibrio hungatei]